MRAIGGLPTEFADRPMPPTTLAAIRTIYRTNGAAFLELANRSRYPRTAFFDTPDHLSEPWQIAHSVAVAEALRAAAGWRRRRHMRSVRRQLAFAVVTSMAAVEECALMQKRLMVRAMSALNTWVYRLSGGTWMGRVPSGAPVLPADHHRPQIRSAAHRAAALPRDGDDFVVVGSQGGAPQHPAWYLNLEADPNAEVVIGRLRVSVAARHAREDDRARLWPRLVAIYPPYRAVPAGNHTRHPSRSPRSGLVIADLYRWLRSRAHG